MSTYLVHGFRWDREKIRDMTVFWNADDVSPNNLMTPSSQVAMIHELKKRFPKIMKRLPGLRLIEPANQYEEVSMWAGAPVVFVCDVVVYTESYLLLDLSKYSIDAKKWDGMQDLLEQLSPNESLQWFVVANNNEEIMPRERARFGLPPPDAQRSSFEDEKEDCEDEDCHSEVTEILSTVSPEDDEDSKEEEEQKQKNGTADKGKDVAQSAGKTERNVSVGESSKAAADKKPGIMKRIFSAKGKEKDTIVHD